MIRNTSDKELGLPVDHFKMNFIRNKFLVYGIVVSVACLSLSNEQTASKLDGLARNNPVEVNNATRSFVAKVFKEYSRNGSKLMAVEDFYSLLKALKIGQVYDVSGTAQKVEKNNYKQPKSEGKLHVHRRSLRDQGKQQDKKIEVLHNQRFHNNVSTVVINGMNLYVSYVFMVRLFTHYFVNTS